MRSYTVDPNAARQANANNYIEETGKYIGHIVTAEATKSRNGTDGIEISFKSNAGQMANFLTLWTYNAEGKDLYGLKVFNALMVCAELQSITPQQSTITDATGTQRAATIFPELSNRPIGLVLQKEFYTKNDGSDGSRFNIYAPFHPQSEKMAKEILDGVSAPKALASLVATLSDKKAPARPQAQQNNQYIAQNNYQNTRNDSFPDDRFGYDFEGGF